MFLQILLYFWWGVSGIYKITFLPFRLFTYYGSSVNLGQRFKFHYYNGRKSKNFLSYFINTFGWNYLSITVVEECSRDCLKDREKFYLKTYNPLINVQIEAYSDSRTNVVSNFTRAKISMSLTGGKNSDHTRKLKSEANLGIKNPNYGVGASKVTLDAAAEAKGRKVFVYRLFYDDQKQETFLTAHQYSPFRSIRQAALHIKIGATTLTNKLNTEKAYKGYFYYSQSLNNDKIK
jgi:group I intron endonuclease